MIFLLMMLGFVADILTTIFTVLFPIFASYKALRDPSPATLSPWLMYWVVLSLFAIVETQFNFILSYIPFYAWFRLGVHLWLVLPGKQGATNIYTVYVDPWLFEHETEIETFITEAHERAKQAGMEYLKQAIAWAKVNVLGQQPAPPSPPPASAQSYAQQLLARFNMPSAAVQSPPDLYSMLSSALTGVAGATGMTREQKAEDLSASGTLIPREMQGKSDEEKMRYVSTTRESLRVLLQAYDKEAYTLASDGSSMRGVASGYDRLSKSRSEVDFDKIDPDEASPPPSAAESGHVPSAQRPTSGNWMPWGWTTGGHERAGPEKKMQ